MRILRYSSICLAGLMIIGSAAAQTDPGVRSSTGVNAGTPLPDLSNGALAFFNNGKGRFQKTEVVSSAAAGANVGLGPRFNLNQCSACHSQPAVGGSSPSATQFPKIGPNPQSQVIANGIAVSPNNSIPSFITSEGPVREARFPFFISSSGAVTTIADGGVHDVFTVSGRSDAGNCNIPQPNFTQAASLNDLAFRIPTPTFGAGFIENIGEDTLIKNLKAQAAASPNFGVSGTFNYNGNDGTISRFGWKAQNKSALLFAGEAYNVEMGITNELFQNERPDPDEEHNLVGLPNSSSNNCINLSGGGYPEDATNFQTTPPPGVANPTPAQLNASIPSDIVMFGIFMRFLDQPGAQPNGYSTSSVTVTAASIARGQTAFSSVGCASCHTPSLTTDASALDGDLSQKVANLFSDLEIHHMGGLADNIGQGSAAGDQFRSAPLWGLGQRIFFLHDGRTTDLVDAIGDHCLAPASGSSFQGSEACTAEANFKALPATSTTSASGITAASRQDVLNFLRSL